MTRNIAMRTLLAVAVLSVSLPGSSRGDDLAAYRESITLEAAGKITEAISALDPIRENGEVNYSLNLRLGYLYYLGGDYPTSSGYYAKAIELRPRSMEARVGQLLPVLAAKNYAEGEKLAIEAIRIEPTNYYANLRLAFALRWQAKFEKAARVGDYMLVIQPSDTALLLERALVHVNLEEWDDAKLKFERVLRIEPANGVATYWIDQIDAKQAGTKVAGG